jgi:Papain-like cysteine protease AvrRpt2
MLRVTMSLLEETRVPLLATRGATAVEAPPEPAWSRLELALQRQQQTQWCWAAVSTSVARYFGDSRWTQCAVVNAELDEDSCCTNGSSPNCNKPWRLDRALERVDALEDKDDGAPDFDAVRDEIDAGRPVGVRIGWSGGGGHFVVIEGYRHDERSVAVEDPWTGSSDVPVEQLRGRYQGRGRWTHTYYTRSP